MNQKSFLFSTLGTLLLMQVFSLKAQTQYTTDQPYMEVVSSENTGKWQFNFVITSENKKTAWIDLNDNGQYDKGEEKITAYGLHKANRTTHKLRVYGKFTLFYCSLNNLTSIDVSHNEGLEHLSCDQNSLTSLDISKNPNLKKLYCNTNQLYGTLDCTHSPLLEEIYCFDNKLQEIKLTGLSKLKDFFCNRCQLKSLDLTGCTSLVNLICFANEIASIALSPAPGLRQLHCHDNRMSREAMAQMMQALPTLEGTSGEAFVIDSEAATEGNHCTDVSVKSLSAKNWKVYDYKAGEWSLYAGESTEAVELPESGLLHCSVLPNVWRIQLPSYLIGQSIRVVDLCGKLRLLQTACNETIELDSSSWGPGCYVLCVGNRSIKVVTR